MDEKNVAMNANETIEQTPVEQKAKKAPKEKKELHDLFWTIGIILGLISIVLVLIAQNAINNKGIYTLNLFFLPKPIKVPFITSWLASVAAGVLAVFSLGFGLARNIMKRQNWLLGYLVGLVALILSVIAYLAVTTVSK